MLKKPNLNSDAGDVDLLYASRQIFEIVALHITMIHELSVQTAVLRKVVELSGVSNDQFEEMMVEARAQLGSETTTTLERVQKLVETLQLKKQ